MCFNEQYLGDEGAGSGRHPTDPIETKDVCAEGEDGRVADLLEGGDSGFSSREASNAGSPSEEARSEVSVDEEWTGVVTRNEERTVISGLSSSSSAPSSAVQHLHVDHQDCFNSFEYWRDPIPDIKLDIDLVEGRAAGIHVRSQVYDEQRRKTFSSELDVVVSDSQPGELEAALEKVTLVQRRDGDDGGERVVLRIVGPAKEVTASLGRPLAQYIPAPPVRPGITLQEFSSQAIIPHDLLHHYVQMIDPAHLQTMDNEVVRFCAHSLPAVALTLGRKYWPLLRHLYETLASDMQVRGQAERKGGGKTLLGKRVLFSHSPVLFCFFVFFFS